MLNSLSFSIQIVIRSKRKDITAYLNLLKDAENKQLYGPLKEQIKKYRQFVETTVRVNNVLDKKFYIVIPFSPLEMGAVSAVGLFGKKKGLPFPKQYILERAKTSLYPKRDHLLRQLSRLGLKAYQLPTTELIQLFYDLYNPGSLGMESIGSIAPGLTTPMVEAAIEGNVPPPQKPTPSPTPPAENNIIVENENKEAALPIPSGILIEEK